MTINYEDISGTEEDQKKEYKIDSKTYKELLEQYFYSYNDFFKNEAAKGLFLLGVASGKLLRAQRKRYKSNENIEPFWGSLFNLVLNKNKIMSIQLKVISKLKQYQKYVIFPHNLIQSMSSYFMNTGDDFGLTDLEISWFFSHGLASYREVTNRNLLTFQKQNKSD